MAGNLEVTWVHGAPDCSASTDRPIQVHRFDADTFILRQSKCSQPLRSFEAPFLYLLIGKSRALLLDTGASSSPALFPLASTIGELLRGHAAASGTPAVPLLIAHSHSHGDHGSGDSQFDGAADTTVVRLGLARVKSFFGLPNWPNGIATIDLGERILDVIPIPGHEESHIAVYDRMTGILLSGDTVYPGLLVVNDWDAYVRSIARLKHFVDAHSVTFILGAHIEMTNQPRRWFGLGVQFQPGEHVLQLAPAHLTELHDALQAMGQHPRVDRHADFIIFPADQPLPPLGP